MGQTRSFFIRIPVLFICSLLLLCNIGLAAQSAPPSVDDYFRQAKQLENKEDYAGAERLYRAALAAYPDQLEVQKRLGIVYQTELRFQESIDTFQAILTKQPKYPEVNFYLGLSYYGLNEFEKSVEAFGREIEADPTSRRARYLDALALQSLHRNGEALIQYEALLKQNPKDARVLFQLVRFHKGASVAALNQLSSLDPDSEMIHILKAESYSDEEKYPEAIEEYKAVLKKNSNSPGIHFALGEAYWKNVRYPEAESELRLALQEDPNHPLANYYLGDILIKKEKSAEAIPMLKITIAANPQFMLAYFLLGKSYAAVGQFQEAVSVLTKAAELDPDYKSTHYQLAQLYGRLNQPARKQAEMEIFRKLYEQERVESLKKNQRSLGNAEGAPAGDKQ
jgi:tetratricopeptide (TPR) repeat protein